MTFFAQQNGSPQIAHVEVLDTHTGGEPTRVVLEGGPDLGNTSLAERVILFREKYDSFREAVVLEPRGSEIVVGALLSPPVNPQAVAGVIFFNNVGYLGMCGHGTIGVACALEYLGKIDPGEHLLETPVGEISFTLGEDKKVSLKNVPSYRYREGVTVDVAGYGRVVGEIAWGGNWFFLVNQVEHPIEIVQENIESLTTFAWKLRTALNEQNITGRDSKEIDHIEVFAPSSNRQKSESINFVLCPGKAYDRSPCGTGTSAKLACMAASGKLAPGEIYRQESIIGSVFEGFYELGDNEGEVIPTIRGTAHVSGKNTLLFDPADPFQFGIPATCPTANG